MHWAAVLNSESQASLAARETADRKRFLALSHELLPVRAPLHLHGHRQHRLALQLVR